LIFIGIALPHARPRVCAPARVRARACARPRVCAPARVRARACARPRVCAPARVRVRSRAPGPARDGIRGP